MPHFVGINRSLVDIQQILLIIIIINVTNVAMNSNAAMNNTIIFFFKHDQLQLQMLNFLLQNSMVVVG